MKAMGKNTAKISCFQKNQKIMLTLLRVSAKLLESRKKTEKDTRPTYSNDVYTWDILKDLFMKPFPMGTEFQIFCTFIW